MKAIGNIIRVFVLVLVAWSCTHEEIPIPDPDPDAIASLDELVDMETYTEGMIVDSRLFNQERTCVIQVNDREYSSPVSLDLSGAGYYHIEVRTENSPDRNAGIIRLVVLDSERGQAEWGLPPWTPEGVVTEAIGNQEIRMIYPPSVPAGTSFPLIVLADGQLSHSLLNLGARVGSRGFLIKRGVGSVWPDPGEAGSPELVIDHRTFPLSVSELAGPPFSLSGTLTEDRHIPAGTYLHIPADLRIPSGLTLSIDSGAYILVDEAVNIYNDGILQIRGSTNAPVTVSCSDDQAYWGGVIGYSGGNRVEATHTIFSRSGYHTGAGYDWGHAGRQALFYSEEGSLSFAHCYMIDHIGQVFYPISSDLELDYCLVQRAKTGGQLNSSKVRIDHCVFTDFPDDSDVYRNEDNDGLYLIECVAEISNSVFMYARDDGLDSGGGSVGGDVTVSNTRFESVFHEGAALSGGGTTGEEKMQSFYSCIFTDCGQGLELGFSSKLHNVIVDSCRFIRNGIGIRYGDNYEYPNNGYIFISDSESLDNQVNDVWNMDRQDWVADTANMVFSNFSVSKPSPMYPQLKVKE